MRPIRSPVPPGRTRRSGDPRGSCPRGGGSSEGDREGLDGCPECGHPLTDFGAVLVCDVCGFPRITRPSTNAGDRWVGHDRPRRGVRPGGLDPRWGVAAAGGRTGCGTGYSQASETGSEADAEFRSWSELDDDGAVAFDNS